MKTKIISLLATISVVAIAIFVLFNNKKQIQEGVKANLDYNYDIPVKIHTAGIDTFVTSFLENGVFLGKDQVTVTSQSSGRVSGKIAHTGKYVKKGDNLAFIDVDLLSERKKSAEQNMNNAVKDLERIDTLYRAEAATLRDLEAARLNFLTAQTAVAQLEMEERDSYVRAPASGYITSKMYFAGDWVTSGSVMFTISNLEEMILRVYLTAEKANLVKIGSKAIIYIGKETESTLQGTVVEMVMTPDMAGRYQTDVLITNISSLSGKRVLPGSTGSARFIGGEVSMVVLPRKCLTGGILDANVFVVEGDSVSIRKIKADYLDEYRIAIKEGVAVGEKVVSSGQMNLVNGSKVKVMGENQNRQK